MLSTCEFASLVLLSGFALFLAFKKPSAFMSLGRIALQAMKPPISTVIVSFWAYTLFFVWLASRVGLWEEDLWKETVLFLVIGAFATVSKSLSADDDPHYFRTAMKQTFALTLLIEFVFGIVSFPLWIELVIQPTMALAIGVQIVAQRREGAEQVASCLETLLALTGFAFLAATLVVIWQERSEIDWTTQGLVLALLVWLPLVNLPYVYVLSWGLNYGRFLSLIRVQRDTTRIPWHARPAIVFGFRWDLYALGQARGRVAGEIAWSESFGQSYGAVRRFSSALPRTKSDG
ncbi:hypothetical protein KUV85_14395 [Nocardioides panacisoli]|uniref:hypothetical protein n=1 Tax=Nocardioides panacisoli TaxID=627624 RepID=UPI001C62F11B|nr:hypothetical protein [Nocardioides panacisoli]QYJ03505.1 hypothetical protein KUV85_14395 [Nocardioides panacisoli]